MKEVVKYNNYMNELSFKNFSSYDLDFFMAICAKMKDLGEETQVFEYQTIMTLLKWDKSKSLDVFHRDLQRMCDRLRNVGATFPLDSDTFSSFNLFSDFVGNKKKKTLIVRINPRFKYILNDLTKNFTRFELSEYINLDGKYSKLLYQHLKQYRKSGWWNVSLSDFRNYMAIPDSMPTYNITTKVIKPSLNIIQTCVGFGDIKYEVIKNTCQNHAIIGYKFTWTALKQIPGQMTIDDYLQLNLKNKHTKNKEPDFKQNQYNFDELEKRLIAN